MSPGAPRIIIRRNAAIGDCLAATVVTDRLASLGYECELQAHPDMHCVLRHVKSVSALSTPNGYAHVDLDRSYETNPARRTLHFSEMFMSRASETLGPLGITLGPPLNCRPRMHLPKELVEIARAKFEPYPRPWVFLVPRSNSYAVRQVPDSVWESAAAKIDGTKFWLGTMPAPKGIVDLGARHLDNVIAWLSVADLVISVDTGPMHIAAALNRQILALGQSSSPELHLSDKVDYETLWPSGDLKCLNCQENVCRINHYLPPCQSFDPDYVAGRANYKLRARSTGHASALISIFRPEASVLNRCLESVLPQVQEVILCRDQAGILPNGTVRHDKIKLVEQRLFDIGYGRKQNRAARASSGEYLLLLNDDVFLAPNAVALMIDVFKANPQAGMVSNLLRYPDGTIYHAGKTRAPGQMGWSHLNFRQHLPDLREVTEMENCCGACVLVSRRAFYQIGGFDEDFYLYAEDDDFALRLRHAGYKIFFTPHSSAIHLEHQSTTKTGSLIDHLQKSNRTFGKKWGRYLEYNSNRIPGSFDYLKA
jgi:hypothetical protein